MRLSSIKPNIVDMDRSGSIAIVRARRLSRRTPVVKPVVRKSKRAAINVDKITPQMAAEILKALDIPA